MDNSRSHISMPDELLERYLLGDASPEEAAQVEQFFQDAPNEAEFARVLKGASFTPSLWPQESREELYRSLVLEPLAHGSERPAGVFSGMKLRRWMGYGITAAAFGILGFVSWQVHQSSSTKPSTTVQATTYTTRSGQRASLTLGDGSRVTLGPATTLHIFSSGTATDVQVTGEALFNVSHASQRSFVVTTHGVITRVLGTEFVIRAYDASNVRVAVRDGRVSVQTPLFTSTSAAIVNAGEATNVVPNALPVVMPISDLATDFAWSNGELVLRNVPLGDALNRLSRWYGVEFKITDPELLESHVDAAFASAFSMTRIDILARAIGARARYAQGVITFSLKE